MLPEALEKELNSGKISSSIYLLYGSERYMLENAVKKIRKNFGELVQGINYVILDDNGIDEIIPNIEIATSNSTNVNPLLFLVFFCSMELLMLVELFLK